MSSKYPVKPGNKYIFHRRELGQKLHLPQIDFDLSDPNCQSLKTEYKSLHDPHLKNYYHRTAMQKHLLTEGYITKNKKVKCSLQEFNQYHNYIERKIAEFNRKYMKEQDEIKRQIEAMNKKSAQTMEKIREKEEHKQRLLKKLEKGRPKFK